MEDKERLTLLLTILITLIIGTFVIKMIITISNTCVKIYNLHKEKIINNHIRNL